MSLFWELNQVSIIFYRVPSSKDQLQFLLHLQEAYHGKSEEPSLGFIKIETDFCNL